jgi:general secretion pathway protein K
MQNHDAQTGSDDRQRGFALIVVIWIAILLSLMAAAFSSSVRSRLRTVATHADLVRTEALADAGVRIALMALLNRDPNSNMPPRFLEDGNPVACSIGGDAGLIIQVEDEEGKVNLNTQNEDLIIALFSGLGAGEDNARSYAQKILDFRDSDQEKRPDGAERADYIKSSTPGASPKDADFVSVEELDQVLGLPADIRERAKPFLSAFSSSVGLDLTVAPPGLRDILVRGTNGIVATTANGAGDGVVSISSDLPPTFLSRSTRRSYTIRAEAVLQTGARFVSDALVGLPDSAAGIPIFQHWRRGTSRLPAGQTIPDAKSLKPC